MTIAPDGECGNCVRNRADQFHEALVDRATYQDGTHMKPGCTAEVCERALEVYLARYILTLVPKPAGPSLVCWETQDGAEPVRLSFAVKVF